MCSRQEITEETQNDVNAKVANENKVSFADDRCKAVCLLHGLNCTSVNGHNGPHQHAAYSTDCAWKEK